MVNLGVLEDEQGNLGQARHWYQQAIGTGHPDQAPRAMFNLGVLEGAGQPRPGPALVAARPSVPATPTRHPGRCSTSASWKTSEGNLGQARHWYQQAIGTGHPDQAPKAMVNLGVLEDEQGNPGQARHW